MTTLFMSAINSVASASLPKAGGTVTGSLALSSNVTIGRPSAYASAYTLDVSGECWWEYYVSRTPSSHIGRFERKQCRTVREIHSTNVQYHIGWRVLD